MDTLFIRMLDNVQQKTIKAIIEKYVQKGSLVYSDEYRIYDPLEQWGYSHKQVCHSIGEYARDDDGDGFCEVHVNVRTLVLRGMHWNQAQGILNKQEV